jgi:hypothetical protein
VGIGLVATNEGDLNEKDRAHRGDRGKDVFAETIVPEIVHRRAETDQYKTPDIETELD